MAEVVADWGSAALTDNTGNASRDAFIPDASFEAVHTSGSAEMFSGGFQPQNISKHDQAPHDGGCRVCGAEGHFARDCPDKPANTGECFRCGQLGHNKADCPVAAVVHCRACRGQGHAASECPANRLFLAHGVTAEASAVDAWKMLWNADRDRDLDDIKSGILLYAKSCPEATFAQLESNLREGEMNTHLIAKEQTLPLTHTAVNLQGQPDQKYVVTLHFSATPRRKRQDEGWPADAEENMSRLAEAGFVTDSFVVVCNNCGDVGHMRAKCNQEKQEAESIGIECSLCNEKGHRARDCTAPRRKPGGSRECRNCGETGHISKDCPSREIRACKRCGSTEHMAKECGKPRDPSTITCRNCDAVGHVSKECPQPTDWSRVLCSNCGEKGHSYKRCKAPATEPGEKNTGAGDGGWCNDASAGGGGGW